MANINQVLNKIVDAQTKVRELIREALEPPINGTTESVVHLLYQIDWSLDEAKTKVNYIIEKGWVS